MGLLIKQYKNGKYGLWTTVTDGYLTIPAAISKKEAIRILCERVDYRADQEKEDIRKNFPYGWCDKTTGRYIMRPPQLNNNN